MIKNSCTSGSRELISSKSTESTVAFLVGVYYYMHSEPCLLYTLNSLTIVASFEEPDLELKLSSEICGSLQSLKVRV